MDIGEDDRKILETTQRTRLRERCELATVLNFLTTFEPLIQSKLKVSAEDVEMAIIDSNDLLSKLHLILLKGIPPVSKTLNNSDAWVVALHKKLTDWWPLVAGGDMPLKVIKGKEISDYKKLEPTTRLVVLKALCEIRLKQDDAVSYINNALKTGSEVSSFRKNKICGDERGTSYWLDGDAFIGYRLYKEVCKFESKPNNKGKGFLPAINIQWETLATNLEEFREVVFEFSSSKTRLEVDVGRTVEVDVVPVLEKIQKKKERAVKQQKRQETLLHGIQNSGLARSSRTRKAVSYTYDDYDKAISEAITIQQQAKKRKTTKGREDVKTHSDGKKEIKSASKESSESKLMKQREGGKQNDKETKAASPGSSEVDIKSQDGIASDSETEIDRLDEGDTDNSSDAEYDNDMSENGNAPNSSDKESDAEYDNDMSEDGNAPNSSDKENNNPGNNHVTYGSRQERYSNRGAKAALKKRPTGGSSLDSFIAPDSEEANSSGDSIERSSSRNLSEDSDN